MANLTTLLHFMRYFAPHCIEQNGTRVCYISALEYPDRTDARDALDGNGFMDGPQSLRLRYVVLEGDGGQERWRFENDAGPGRYPVWEAR